ncbi:hypothetical protein [Salinimicrobium sp. WS361]|uniref:hypothetical protein n=1 Tax=Salinimicrobium sp. WS361 TaxID=3425123 RepID=UPI003D6FD35F
MKLDIIIVDFALVAAIFVPYLLFILIGRKAVKKLKEKFSEVAKKHQLSFDEKTIWNNNIVGLDRKSAKILFVQKRKSGILAEIIDLREVTKSEVLKHVQTVKVDQRTEDILQKLELRLQLHNGCEQILGLYDCEESYAQDYELKNAEKWNAIINSVVVFRPTINSAA